MQDYLATVHNANGAGTAGRLGNRLVVHGAIHITGMKSNYPKRRKEMSQKAMMEWIDNASYEDLLTKLRFAPVGDPFFMGEVGDYFMAVMTKRRDADLAEHTRVSKKIGW